MSKRPASTPLEVLREDHRRKMADKKDQRPPAGTRHPSPKMDRYKYVFATKGGKRGKFYAPFVPASINRHTGKPHEHKRARSMGR